MTCGPLKKGRSLKSFHGPRAHHPFLEAEDLLDHQFLEDLLGRGACRRKWWQLPFVDNFLGTWNLFRFFAPIREPALVVYSVFYVQNSVFDLCLIILQI